MPNTVVVTKIFIILTCRYNFSNPGAHRTKNMFPLIFQAMV